MHLSSSSPEPAPPPDFPVSINSTASLPVPQAPNLSHLQLLPTLPWCTVLPLLELQVTLPALSWVLIVTAVHNSAAGSDLDTCLAPSTYWLCVTLGKLINFSELSFLSCKMRIIITVPSS